MGHSSQCSTTLALFVRPSPHFLFPPSHIAVNRRTKSARGFHYVGTIGTLCTVDFSPVFICIFQIKLPVKWELVGDGEVDIICFEIGVQIVPDKSVNGYQML